MSEQTPTTTHTTLTAGPAGAPARPLSEAQGQILDASLLDSGFNLVLQLPTGAGKTWLAGVAIGRALARGERAIYLTPLRALAHELVGRWRPAFETLGRVGVFTGDYNAPGKPPYPVPFEDARLLVMTPERLDLATRNWRKNIGWLAEASVLVVDELHLLGDGGRGARLEGTVSRFRRLNPLARVLAMSATLGNRRELAGWLDAAEFADAERPVPLRWKVVRFKRGSDKPQLAEREVLRNVSAGGKSLVFVHSRRRAEELAGYFRATGLRASHHHAGLTRGERARAEESFRSSGVDVLVATSTLEMGLNLPASQVVVYDNQTFEGGRFEPLPVNNVWQRVGRAGRPGLDAEGEAVIIAPAWDHSAGSYERGQFEPVLSRLSSAPALAEQIVVEVASGLARDEVQLREVFGHSLAAAQGRLPRLSPVLTRMREAHMIADAPGGERGQLRATRLGRAAVRHMLSPDTVLLFRHVFGRTHELTAFDLLLVAACADDCEVRLPVDFEELGALADAVSAEPTHLLQAGRRELAGLVLADGKRLLSAIKAAAVMKAWTRTGDRERTAADYGCYPAEVEQLREALERVARAMLAVYRQLPYVEFPEEAFDRDAAPPPPTPLERRLRALTQMLASGVPEESASLFDVKGVGFRTARLLRTLGVPDADALARSDWERLGQCRGISAERARRWVHEAARLVAERATYDDLPEGPLPRLASVAEWPEGVDRYRFTRALHLRVEPTGEGRYRVTGGADPHDVSAEGDAVLCDCPDAAKGNTCKHSLAVRLHRGDADLTALSDTAAGGTADDAHGRLNLSHLWSAETPERRPLFETF